MHLRRRSGGDCDRYETKCIPIAVLTHARGDAEGTFEFACELGAAGFESPSVDILFSRDVIARLCGGLEVSTASSATHLSGTNAGGMASDSAGSVLTYTVRTTSLILRPLHPRACSYAV